MIYILAVLLPPLGLAAQRTAVFGDFQRLLIVFCLIFGWFFPVLFLVPSIHGVVAVHMKREDRKHREIVEAIERHGPPPGWREVCSARVTAPRRASSAPRCSMSSPD